MKHLLTLMAFAVFTLAGSSAWASGPSNSEDNVAGTVMMSDAYSAKAMTKAETRAAKKAAKHATKAEKRMIKMEKRMAKLNDMLAKKMNKKSLGGLDDPIDKFLWWAIIAAAAAIIFSFFLWPVSVVLWIGSLVLLVLWIIKKYG